MKAFLTSEENHSKGHPRVLFSSEHLKRRTTAVEDIDGPRDDSTESEKAIELKARLFIFVAGWTLSQTGREAGAGELLWLGLWLRLQ